MTGSNANAVKLLISDLKSLSAHLESLANDFESQAFGSRNLSGDVLPGADEEKELKLEDVRTVLNAKIRQEKTDKVRLLLEKYGAKTLSAVKPEDYKNLLREAEAL